MRQATRRRWSHCHTSRTACTHGGAGAKRVKKRLCGFQPTREGWKKCETSRICETPLSTFFASHRRSPCEPQRLRTACRAPATGLPAAQPHSLRRQLVGSAWTRARRDGNPTHGASTRLRFCNKVCLACAGDAQSSRDDAGSLGSTSKADLVAKNLCSIRRWFTVDVCVGQLSRRLRAAEDCL